MSAGSAGHDWCKRVRGGRPGGLDGIDNVWAASPTDAWFTSFEAFGLVTSVDYEPRLLHYDGKTFCMADLDSVFPDGDSRRQSPLYTIWGSSPNDIWAAGEAGPVTGNLAVAVHWDGREWQGVDLGFGANHSVVQIVGTGASDVYAVSGARLRRWDGNAWAAYPVTGIAANHTLREIWIDSKHRIWGLVGPKGEKCKVYLIENGAATCSYSAGNLVTVRGIDGVDDQPWLVASGWDVAATNTVAIMVHFDGTAWKAWDFAQRGLELHSVRAFSRAEVWAGGDGAYFWSNGTEYFRHPVPIIASENGYGIYRLRGPSRNDVWAFAGIGDTGDALFHFDGQAWRKMAP